MIPAARINCPHLGDSTATKLGAEIEKIVRLPDIRDKWIQLGAEPRYLNPEQLAGFVAVELPKWGQLIRAAGVTAD